MDKYNPSYISSDWLIIEKIFDIEGSATNPINLDSDQDNASMSLSFQHISNELRTAYENIRHESQHHFSRRTCPLFRNECGCFGSSPRKHHAQI